LITVAICGYFLSTARTPRTQTVSFR